MILNNPILLRLWRNIPTLTLIIERKENGFELL